MSRETIAKSLKRLREQIGLTADQVGVLVGKSGKTVNAWENNRGQPDAEMLMKLCDIYNVSDILAEFRDNENDMPFALSEHEKNIIMAYRNKPDMQAAVDRLLGVKYIAPVRKLAEVPEEERIIYRAAMSSDNHEHQIEKRSKSDLEKLANAEKITSEEDL